jgi:hypothetical protein
MATTANGVSTPSTNGNGKHDAPKTLTREEQKKRILRAPTTKYQPSGNHWWGWGSASLDGAPVFTWADIPRMWRDPTTVFVSQLWRAPFQKVEFTVKASAPKIANFVLNTVKRFWRSSLPKLLARYFEYGFAPGGAEYTALRGKLRLARVKTVEPQDAQPRIFKAGDRLGQFAGFELQNRMPGAPATAFVGPPHAFWFGGQERLGRFFDRPPISGMFEPWLEKRGRTGAVHMRRVWYRKNAARGMIGYYPPGVSNCGTDESPQMRDNQDLMREVLDMGETNSTYAFENTLMPGTEEPEWQIKDAFAQGDIAGFRDYPKDLDEEMIKGAGIPLEVIQGSDSGSGYKGRLVSYGGFLGTVDELVGLILEACEPWLSPLVALNYGRDAWYEIEPVSLAKIAAEEEKRQPTNPVGQPLATLPGGGGSPPAGGAGEGQGGGAPFQLSVTAPPNQNGEVLDAIKALAGSILAALKTRETTAPIPALTPDPVAAGFWEYQCPECGGCAYNGDPMTGARFRGSARCAGCGHTFAIIGRKPVRVPEPTDLSATAASGGPSAKENEQAFEQTQSRLMRVRKSTIAQLLALAMLRKQQAATAAGTPEAAAGSLEELANLASDPIQVARIVGMRDLSALELAWTAFQTAKNTVGAVSDTLKDSLGRPKKLYGRAARQALEAHERREKREASEKRGLEILQKVARNKASLEQVAELATHLPVMRLEKINDARKALEFHGLNMRGEKTKAHRVERLLDYVEKKVGAAPSKPDLPEKGREGRKPKEEPAPAAAEPVPPAAGVELKPDGTVVPLEAAPVPPKEEPEASSEPEKEPAPDPEENPADVVRGAIAAVLRSDEYAGAGSVGKRTHTIPLSRLRAALVGAGVTSRDAQDDAIFEATHRDQGARGKFYLAAPTYDQLGTDEMKSVIPGVAGTGSGRIGNVQVNDADVTHWTGTVPEPEKTPTPAPGVSPDTPEPAPTPAKKKRTGKAVEVSAAESAKIKAAVAFNAVLAAAKENANDDRLGSLVDRAKAAVADWPEKARATYLRYLATAAKGEGEAVKVPEAGELEDVQPEEETPPTPEAPAEPPEAPDDDDETPARRPKDILEGKVADAHEAWQAAVAKKRPAKEVARLRKRVEELASRLPPDRREQYVGAPAEKAKAAVSGLLNDPATQALLAKRRAKAAPAPAPTPAREDTADAKAAAEVAEPEPAPAPEAAEPKSPPRREPKKPPKAKPGGKSRVPAAPPVASLAKDPGADRAAVAALAAAAPSPEAKSAIEDALHNLRSPEFDMTPDDRRRQTVERLGSAWRDAVAAGQTAGAEYAAQALRQFGAEIAGEKPGAATRYDGYRHEAEAGMFPGDPAVVVRQPVVVRYPDGSEHVAVKGVVKRRTVGGS